MKNFRKVLALVLVVATLFSFAAMASAKYEDEDKISYDEAVSVLSQMGILNGYEDDTFKPTNNISREEMAKMIAVLANGGADVSKLYASANTFADVENDRWSASYIAYCAQTGIVAGRTATTFDPYGNITGLETAKMLLVVLGFDAKEQGYEYDANWKVNILRDAKVMGLTTGFAADYDIEAKITREEAAQMMLNALEAPCVVGILSDSIIAVTNALVFNKETVKADTLSYTKVTSYATLKDALAAGKWSLYENVVISDDVLAEVLYDMKKVGDIDCYGRPGKIWEYKNAAGAVKTIAATTNSAIFSSHDTTEAKVKAALKVYTDAKLNGELWVNGRQIDDVNTHQKLSYLIDQLDKQLGHGTVVEAYKCYNTAGELYIRLVVIHTYIGEIEAVNVRTGEVKISGTFYKNEFGFTQANVGKYVRAWWCATEAADKCLHDAEIITPEIVTVKTATDSFTNQTFTTTEGKVFEYAKQFNNWIDLEGLVIIGDGEFAGNDWVGAEIKVYTDSYGFVLAYELNAAEETVAVVEDDSLYISAEYYANGKYTRDAHIDLLGFAAGVPETEDAALALTEIPDLTYSKGDLVKYVLNDDDQVVITASGTPVIGAHMKAESGVILNAFGQSIGKGATDETQYIIRTKDFSTGKFVYNYFVGKDNLDLDYVADYLEYFTDADTGKFLTYVYAECTVASEAKTAFLLKKAYNEVTLTDGNVKLGYTGYDALVGGEKAVIVTRQMNLTTDRLYTSTYVYIGVSTANGLPVYEALTENELAPLYGNLSYKAGTLVDDFGNVFNIADDAKLIVAFENDWDDDGKEETDKLSYKVLTMAELPDYCGPDAGWGNVWFDGERPCSYIITDDVTDEVIELYLVYNN